MLVDAVGQEPALVEADVARRGADQPRDGVLLHVLRHVETEQLDAHQVGELARHLGLADAGGAREEIAADRFLGLAQAGAGELDGAGQRLDRLFLAEHQALQVLLDVEEDLGVRLGDGLGRNAGHGGNRDLHLLDGDLLLALGLGHQHLRGAGLVDHVDGLVGQLAVVDILGRQLHRRLDGVVGVLELVILLEVGLEAFQDLDGILHRGLLDVDLLEPADKGPVLLEVLPVLLVGGRADAAQRARLQGRLEEVGGVHGPARGGTGADDGVDLIDEEDRAGVVLDLLHHRLEALLEVAAVAGAGQKGAHVEGKDGGAAQDLRHVAVDNLAGEALGDGGLADAGVAHEQRVVLLAPAQHLDGAHHLGLAPDQRVDAADLGLLVEVDAVGVERVLRLLLAVLAALAVLVLVHPAHVLGVGHARPLGDAVRDVLHRLEAGHLLLLQEEGGVALALGEDGDQHVGARDLLAPGGLHVHHRAMDHALKSGGGLGLARSLHEQGGELVVEVLGDAAPQLVDVDRAGLHDGRCVAVIEQREQEVLERGVLVMALVGVLQGAMQRGFQALREGGHGGELLLFHRTLQRMLILPREIHHLGNLGLGHLVGIDATDADTLVMHMEHDTRGIFTAFVEETLQHVHHKLHRRVVVVQQQHLVQARLLGLGACLGDEAGLALIVTP